MGRKDAESRGRVLDGKEWNEYPMDGRRSIELPIAI
jgi:hypothetical protein